MLHVSPTIRSNSPQLSLVPPVRRNSPNFAAIRPISPQFAAIRSNSLQFADNPPPSPTFRRQFAFHQVELRCHKESNEIIQDVVAVVIDAGRRRPTPELHSVCLFAVLHLMQRYPIHLTKPIPRQARRSLL